MNVLDLRLLGRLGGIGLLAGALASLLLVVLPRWGTAAGSAGVVGVILAASAGIAALRSRWEDQAQLAGMALAIGTSVFIGINGLMTSADAVYGPFYVVVFVWTGLALGPGRCLPLIPSTFLCYLLPSSMGDAGDLPASLGALVIATLTGEVLAHLAEQLRADARRKRGREQDLQRLVSGQIELATTANPQQAADASVRLAARLLRAEAAALLLLRDGRRELVAAWPPPKSDAEDTEPEPYSFDDLDPHESTDDGEGAYPTLELFGPDDDPGPTHTSGTGIPGLSGRAAVEVPLRGRPGSGVRGVLAVRTSRAGRPDAFRAGLLRSLAAATTAALESLALTERLRLSAEIDPLTGLGNRRRLGSLLERLAPGDAVISLDIDRFKAVNDTLGHAAGDEVLREFGTFLGEATRAGELAIRTGGEEFVIVASNASRRDESDENATAEPLAAMLDRLGRAWARRYPVTSFSAGVAVFTGGSPDLVLRRADEALYEAKHHGRSCAWIVEHGRSTKSGTLLTLPGTPFEPGGPAGRGGDGWLDLTNAPIGSRRSA